jgi:hypothetical protein
MKKIDYNTKEKLINLSGACFWYWGNFYSFLETCGIPQNIYKQFGKDGGKYQVMRSVLELLERQQKYDLIENIAKEFYNLSPSEENIDREKAKKLLSELRSILGTSFLQEELKQNEAQERIIKTQLIQEQKKIRKEKLLEIKNTFFVLCNESNKQKRGYELEKLFYELVELEEFEYNKPYKIEGEQIDGHFKYEKFDYLVEVKWIDENCKQSDLAIFDTKIRGKAQSTRGFFLSISGFDFNSIRKFSGDSPRIILMEATDLISVLEERISFFDLMKYKLDQLVRKGLIYAKYEN